MAGSTTTAFPFGQLPLEILYSIFYYLDIQDILRARRVSRYLNQVSHSGTVWNDAYRKAEFVRPPGPFFWQTAQDLEKALVPSFRVHRNLRHGGGTSPAQRPAIKLREIQCTGEEIRVGFVFGRFLLIAFKEEIHCHDLDAFESNSSMNVVYRSTGRILKSFHCVSAIDVEGRPFACAVLNEATDTTRQISIYSLNVGKRSGVRMDLLHQLECTTFDIRSVVLGPRVIVIQSEVYRHPYGQPDKHVFAMDVHSRTEFLFPSFTHAAWEAAEVSVSPVTGGICTRTSISTSTHILLTLSFYALAVGWSTSILAFTLPPADTDRRSTSTPTLLSLSHRNVIPGIILGEGECVLLHNATVDPTTQDVLIAIRVRPWRPVEPPLNHGILRLSIPSSSGGEPATGTIAFQPVHSPGALLSMPFLHPSFNGLGRAFYSVQPNVYGTISTIEYNLAAQDVNSVDDEEQAKIVEYSSILQFPSSRGLLDYDAYFGRICLRSHASTYGIIEVLDLAV